MSKVRCKFCKNQSDGRCLKKKKKGGFIKVEVSKSRVCSMYEESPSLVLLDYQKSQAHQRKIRDSKLKN